jgi:uncharacterized membrane protein
MIGVYWTASHISLLGPIPVMFGVNVQNPMPQNRGIIIAAMMGLACES